MFLAENCTEPAQFRQHRKQYMVTIETSVKKKKITFHVSVGPNIAMNFVNSLQMYHIVCVKLNVARNCYNLLNGALWAYVGYLC
jgi:hypothetical protein